MRALVCILFLTLFSARADAQVIDDAHFQKQKNKNSEKSDHFGKNRRDAIWSHSQSQYRPFGWHLDPGVTYMLGNSSNDKGTNYNLNPSGTPGYYVEIGLEHLFKKAQKVVHYFDYGIGMKHFGGVERYKSDDGTKDRGAFNFGSVFARAAIHNVWQLNLYNFIDQSIGFNFDFRLYGGKDAVAEGKYSPPQGSINEGKMVMGLNYSIGWGIKMRDGFFIVPTLQMPIMKFLSWQGMNPSHTWFQSRYEPMILTVKLAWLFPKKGCPPVYDGGNSKQQSDQYQMR
ncbi:hypothetical protein JYT74_00525 [Crocinitomix catalasitica]|nr:hypothetical protein [Crocinitomix catalasitica]